MGVLEFTIGILLAYISVIVLIVGSIYKFLTWIKVPVPLKVPLTPGPTTYTGVVARLATDAFLFRPLLKGAKKLWMGGWIFHVLLLTTIIAHIINILFHDLWSVIGYSWYDIIGYTGIIFAGALAFLIVRRIVMPNLRYISHLSDYLILLLLISIVLLGDYVRFYSGVDVKQVSAFIYSLIYLKPIEPPSNIYFLLHMFLVELLMIYIPFSKVMHFIGIFLNPVKNQRNDARMRRKVNPWDFPVEIMSWEEYYNKFKDELEMIERGG
ncbi:MAG: respiratory nitrate reductase subunit gamma [Candidatus Methanodesulfokora washburnensis]|jgi:nitrate reductase gamma subunit